MRRYNLSIGDLSVPLTRFESFPERKLANTGETNYSIIGTPVDDGPYYEPKHIWSAIAEVTQEEYRLLWAIFKYSDGLRRNQGNYRITLDDTLEPFIEYGARTRAIVPGQPEVNFSGWVEYPARFYVRMFEPTARFQRNTVYPWRVSFTLKELDKFVIGGGSGGGELPTIPVVSGDKHFEFTQTSSLAIWVINHNLNKFPSVRVTDDSNNEIIGFDVSDINKNSLRITFSQPTIGKAYLN
jgi:hypothetical protein